MPSYFQGLLGIAVFVLVAWVVSENRRAIAWPVVATGLALQAVLALILTFVPPVKALFHLLASGVRALQAASHEGVVFVFGYLGGGELPFELSGDGSPYIVAFQVLPLILLVGALAALLWHWKVLMALVRAAAWAMERGFRVGGAVGVSAAANIIMGMVEAPLLIRPYIARLSRGELFAVMAGGMATIAGTMMVLIGSVLDSLIPNAFSHVLVASVINAPAALMLAKIIVPDESRAQPTTVVLSSDYRSALDAITQGTANAVKLLLNIIALLIVFIALIALVNSALGMLPMGDRGPLTLQQIMGAIMAPVAWLVGIPWAEAQTAGALFGTKVVANEFLAYLELVALPPDALTARSELILSYAFCSFSNFGSLAIMIGGLSAMAPERSAEIAGLGFRALLAGFLAGCLTACLIGLLMSWG
jgi:CNT family concentrative nucleoside transporter